MPSFADRNKAGLVLAAVLLVVWIVSLVVSRVDRPDEDPDRWVKGPPSIAGAAPIADSAADPD